MMSVKRYSKRDEKIWNDFVARSANGTFILDRRFLEYHSDRYKDHSLIIWNDTRPVAVFPANGKGTVIQSHGGLTYGGLIVPINHSLLTTIASIRAILSYYYKHGFSRVVYKPVPSCFHTRPFYDDIYTLFLAKATLTTMNTGFVTSVPAQITHRRMRMVKKAQQAGVTIKQAKTTYTFWDEILMPHLAHKFHSLPVHTNEEIEKLRRWFPKNILQYHAVINNSLVAGVTFFVDHGVAHAQYIASNSRGRDVGALDYLFWYVITRMKGIASVSFGTANMGSVDGRALSPGLVQWKEGFGSIMLPYPWYTVETENYRLLQRYSS